MRICRLLFCLALTAVVIAAQPSRAADAGKQLRIGYQKSGTLALLKQRAELGTRLAELQATLAWVEFQSGPPLLEAINAGSVDLGAVGDTPPIFAQAAGAGIAYVGYLSNPGRNIALLVHDDAPFDSIAELKGKKIGFTKSSSAHNFIVTALADSGLAYTDIQPAYLQPADAAAAFRNGSIDAWAIWDPFYAQTELSEKVRVLITAERVAPLELVHSGAAGLRRASPQYRRRRDRRHRRRFALVRNASG